MLRYVESVFLCLREDLKEKSGRLRNFCLPVSPLYFLFFFIFFNGPGQTVMCSLYIYTSKYLKENFTVRCIIFSLRIDIGKRTIIFSLLTVTGCNLQLGKRTIIFSLLTVTGCNLQLCILKKNRQTRPRKADESVVRIEDNSFIFEISSLFQRENYNKAVNEQLKTKCSKLHSSGIQLYSGYELWKKGRKTAEILEFYTLQNSSMADN